MGVFDVVVGTERPNKMPAGRKPTGINCRNRGRANDGGLGVGEPPSSIPGGTRWVRPYSLGRAEGEPDRGHEKSAAVFTGRSNDPTLVGITGSEAVRVSTGRFRFSGRVCFAQNMQDRERDLRGVCVLGEVGTCCSLAPSWSSVRLRPTHCLKSEHVLDGALITGCRFVGELLDGGFLLGDARTAPWGTGYAGMVCHSRPDIRRSARS